MTPAADLARVPSTPRFLATFVLVAALGFALVLNAWFNSHVVIPMTEAIARITAGVVQWAGGSAEVAGATIRHEGGFAVTVATRCSALEPVVLLWAGMLAFPARWRERCMGLVAGTLAVLSLNLVRIIFLYGVGPHSATLFEWAHLYASDLLTMLPGLVVFLMWMHWLPSRRGARAPQAKLRKWRELCGWLALVGLLLFALATATWWLRFPDRAWEAARVLADAAGPIVFDGRVREVAFHAEGTWKVRTNLPLAGTGGTRLAIFFVGPPPILKGLVAFPLLWALLIMGPRPRWKRLTLGTLLLAGLVLLQVAALCWLRLTVMLKAEPSFVSAALQPPGFQVAGASVSEWEWVLSNVAYYLAALFGPIVSPLLIWAALSRQGWRALLTKLGGTR